VLVQRCSDCGTWVHYPRQRCSGCLSDRLEWTPTSGRGVVHTFTVTSVPTSPEFADEMPQIISVVELEEGPRVTTTLVDLSPPEVAIGLPVVAAFDAGDDGTTLLRFRPRP
jgi:uncharacterized protein